MADFSFHPAGSLDPMPVGHTGAESAPGGLAAADISGDPGNNLITGSPVAEVIDGGDGIDTVTYVNSAVGVTVDLRLAGPQVSAGDASGDTLVSIESLAGSAFDDTLHGDSGNNVLSGGLGADLLIGGDGADLANYLDSTVGVTVDLRLAGPQVSAGTAAGDVLQEIESLGGSAFDDVLHGDDGDNQFTGAAGADVMIGEGGIDWALYQGSTAGVIVDLSLGTGHGGDAEGDTLSGIENLFGSAFADTLIGDVGNNILDGAGGADTLAGGDGFDTVRYINSAAAVNVGLNVAAFGGEAEGDILSGIEGVIGSVFGDSLAGDAGANMLDGYLGDDRLAGGAGADTMIGGGGIDTAVYLASAAGVTVSLVAGIGLGGDAQGDALTGIENVTGSAFADKLIGDGGANALDGSDGNDVLRGGAGADVLTGGAGLDQANYQGSAAAVSINLLTGAISGGDAAGDTLSGIENLYGSSHDDALTGDNDRNVIGGELGNDTLAGNGGDDSLSGEGGDDSLDGGDGADRLVGGDGIDTIHGGTGNDSVDAGADNDQVFGETGHDAIYGGAGDDVIDGGDGNDVIEGDGGADAIIGGAGIDTASYASSAAAVSVNLATGAVSGGDAAGDTFSGIEQVMGSGFADTLTGDANANTLWGLAGDDVLTGGGGGDALKGGAGNDRFVYTALTDSAVSGIGKDGILDFTAADRIDLSAIDADGNAANGDTAFTFGAGDFTRHAGELRVVTAGALQVVYVDVNGDKAPDFAINVTSDHVLTAADFVL